MTTTRSSPGAEEVDFHAPELDAIRQVLDRYASAVRTGRAKTLSGAFHPRATIAGFTADGLVLMDLHELARQIRSVDPPVRTGEPYRHELQSVLITDRIATVEIFEYSLLGHDYRTCFHMVRIDGRWQITAKLFTSLGAAAS